MNNTTVPILPRQASLQPKSSCDVDCYCEGYFESLIVVYKAAQTMSLAYPLPPLSHETVKNTASLIRIVSLSAIAGAAIASRLFAVINFESIIHELYVGLQV